jgi:hypothetical protein
MTLSQFFSNIKDNPLVQSYIEYLKDTKGSGYSNGYFENGGKHYPKYPLPEFKYHNVKGYLNPIYWGGDYKGNLYYELFGTNEPLPGYTVFGEFTGSLSMGSYGSGQGFIRPYMKSSDNDSHDKWKYVVSVRTASKFLDGKHWTPQNFDSSMSFYHYLALDPSAVRKIKKESANILGELLRKILLAIEEDDAYRTWRDGGGTIAKDVEIKFDLKKVYSELKSEVRPGMRLDQESDDEIQCSIRDWGRWEHDYEDYDRDESDYEDDDYMILSDASYKKMDDIIKKLSDKYQQVSIEWGTSEKNWIDFTITRKANESLNEEDVNEKVKLIMRNILSKMVPAAFGASTNPKMREELKDAVEAAIAPILKKYDYIVESELHEKNFQAMVADEAINYSLSHQSGTGHIVALAATGKDLDKEIESGASKTAIGKDIEDMLNTQLKKFRQDLTVRIDHGYQGAGYAFTLDLEGVLKKLNK